MCWQGRCERCGKAAGPYRWTQKQAAEDIRAAAARGWESSFCPDCVAKVIEAPTATVLPSGMRYTGD